MNMEVATMDILAKNTMIMIEDMTKVVSIQGTDTKTATVEAMSTKAITAKTMEVISTPNMTITTRKVTGTMITIKRNNFRSV